VQPNETRIALTGCEEVITGIVQAMMLAEVNYLVLYEHSDRVESCAERKNPQLLPQRLLALFLGLC